MQHQTKRIKSLNTLGGEVSYIKKEHSVSNQQLSTITEDNVVKEFDRILGLWISGGEKSNTKVIMWLTSAAQTQGSVVWQTQTGSKLNKEPRKIQVFPFKRLGNPQPKLSGLMVDRIFTNDFYR